MELRWIGRKEAGGYFMRDTAEAVVAVCIPDTEQVATAGREHAMNFVIGSVFIWEEHHTELADHGIKAVVREW